MEIYISTNSNVQLMDTTEIRELIEEQKQEFEREIPTIGRQKLEEIENLRKIPHIVVITGLRRAGKSTLLKQIRNRFYPGESIYYMNFEDERLLDFEVGDFACEEDITSVT